ncbi:MAG: DEAD/DEAH box helicase [Candidatus Aminicenantes bacterium]|nr:DEAD/DEAH box helicase [Candidatus Aminicenantes bacterium]
MKFSSLDLHEDILKGIADAGYTQCMPVQEQTLVHSLKGKDVAVQSQTGTGKTAVFLLTIFQHFLGDAPSPPKRALIIAPTRELAVQIEKDAKVLGKYLDFTVGCFYGGVGYYHQEKLLHKGVDVMVGTPGRLLDLSHKKLFDFKEIGFLVIDEADRLFDMGFLPDIRRMLRKMAAYDQRQTMLFSATLDTDTRYLAYENMNDPVNIEIAPEQVTVDKITQELYHVAKKEKLNLLLGLFKKEVPESSLIFTNMKSTAAQVAKHLEYNGYKCLHISGDLPQKKRLQIMESFKAGQLPFLVATDVAARGLHIDDLELIVNYDLPGDCENYVHRIGRTARAGKTGKAISLACEEYVYNLEAIENFIDMKIPVKYADDDLFETNKSAGMDFRPKYDRSRKSRGREKPTRSKSPKHRGPLSARPKRPGGRPDGKSDDRPDRRPDGRPDGRPDREERPAKKRRPAPGPGKEQYKKKTKSEVPKAAGKEAGKAAGKPARQAAAKRPVRKKGTMEDRLEYYRKKYGDDFKVAPGVEAGKGKREKESFFKKISTFIKGKKRGG